LFPLAEFRGPGVHHNFDDSDSGYDVDAENKSRGGGSSFGIGGYKGRIIFLGDGTEVLTDSDDTEMFDNAEEDKDLASQVSKDSSASNAEEASNPHEEIPSPSHPKKLTEAELKLTDEDKTKIQAAAHHPELTKSPETTQESHSDEVKPKDVSEK
jgi:protein phosphatase 2C family protein 2/3